MEGTGSILDYYGITDLQLHSREREKKAISGLQGILLVPLSTKRCLLVLLCSVVEASPKLWQPKYWQATKDSDSLGIKVSVTSPGKEPSQLRPD